MEKSVQVKKVFFLYPHSVIQEKMLQLLIAAEIDVALLWDARKALRVLQRYSDSILFINIDEEYNEKKWEQYIAGIMKHEKFLNVRLGVLSYNEDPELAQKYLIDIGVQCGFVVLKLGLKESARILMATLEAN